MCARACARIPLGEVTFNASKDYFISLMAGLYVFSGLSIAAVWIDVVQSQSQIFQQHACALLCKRRNQLYIFKTAESAQESRELDHRYEYVSVPRG